MVLGELDARYEKWHWGPLGHSRILSRSEGSGSESESAQRKAASKQTQDGLPVHSFRTLLEDLATLTRNDVSMGGQMFQMLASPTPVQERAFQLLQVAP